jgi:hypothetical protein
VTRLVVVIALVAAACGGRRAAPTGPAPASSVRIGDCADPARDGVLGASPALERADLDLDGDQVAEAVATDRNLCSEQGNCHWNLFARQGQGCYRYLGTVAAAAIEPLADRGERGFLDLRGWWRFKDGDRVLMQHYRFRRGGYHVVEAMVCREIDDRLLCAEEAEPGEM